MAPAKKLPRIIRNPGAKSIPGLKKKGYRKAGPKRGRNVYVLPGAKPKPNPKPTTPKVTDPYAAYADYPAFQDTLRLLDRDQQLHQGYVSDKVQPWLAQALTNLTGVNPAQPGIGPTLNQQYLSNVQGVVGGALDATAAATPMPFAPTTPGAITASPTAYMSTAAQEAAGGLKSSALQAAQTQAALGSMQANTVAQGLTYVLADYAKGLPSLYAQRRSEARAKMDQFILEFEEDKRRARVNESINAMNAQANIALGLANLGLDAADVQRRLDESAFDMQQASTPAGPAPYGFVQLPDGRYVRDPTVPAASSSGGGGGKGGGKNTSRRTPVQIRQSGGATIQILGPWAKKPKPMKGVTFEQATDGKWYGTRTRSGSGGSAGSGGGDKPENLRAELDKWYFDKIDQKFEPEAAVRRVGNWVLSRKGRFTRKDGTVNMDAIADLLVGVIGGPTIPEGVKNFLKQYIVNGRWR